MVGTTDYSIDVEWDPPADNGGGEILGYHVDKVRSQLCMIISFKDIYLKLRNMSRIYDFPLQHRLMFLSLMVFFRPWPVLKTGPGLLSVPGRPGLSLSTESVKEPNIWSESLHAMVLERGHQDSQSPCSSRILQVSWRIQERVKKYIERE